MRRGGLVAAALLAGCGGDAPPARQAPAAAPASGPSADAALLGRDLFLVVGKADSYRASHQNRPATRLRDLGLDSLTPETIRRMQVQGGRFTISVHFRRPEGRAVTSCAGDDAVLEDAAMNEGRFTVLCTAPDGTEVPMTVGERSAPRARP